MRTHRKHFVAMIMTFIVLRHCAAQIPIDPTFIASSTSTSTTTTGTSTTTTETSPPAITTTTTAQTVTQPATQPAQCKDPIGDWMYDHGWSTNYNGQVCVCVNGVFRCGESGTEPVVPVCPQSGCECMDYLGNFVAQSGWSTTYQLEQLQCTCVQGYWNCTGMDGAPNRCIHNFQVYNSGDTVPVDTQICQCNNGFVDCGQFTSTGPNVASPSFIPVSSPLSLSPSPITPTFTPTFGISPTSPPVTGAAVDVTVGVGQPPDMSVGVTAPPTDDTIAVQGGAAPGTPVDCLTIYDTLQQVSEQSGEFEILVDAIDAVELQPLLDNPNAQITFFAPTNNAFENLIQALAVELPILLEDPLLDQVLLYHIVNGLVNPNDISTPTNFVTEQGQQLTIASTNGNFTVQSSSGLVGNIIQVAVPACQGLINVLDGVLAPQLQ